MSAEPTRSDLRQERLALLARTDLTGAGLRTALTDLVDRYVAELVTSKPLTVIALGGYGRGEPAPGSDLDLMILHRGERGIAGLVDQVLYPLWDTGLTVDHSVKTVGEALSVGGDDLKAALGLLDARFIVGEKALADEVIARMHQNWRANANKRLPELIDSVRERAVRHGELAFLLEPDLKEARGGLRDYVSMRAAGAAWVVDAPGQRVRSAYDALLDVRGELHRQTSAGRAVDRLTLQEQDGVAKATGRRDADELLRDVAAAGRAIAYAGDETWRRVAAVVHRPRVRLRRTPVVRRPLADGVVEQAGEVVLARDVEPAADPVLVLRVAAAAADNDLPIAPHALERLATECPAIPEPWPTHALGGLLALLGAGPPAIRVIEALDQHDLMTKLLPEWEKVRSKPQRNPLHTFTVDRHLVEAASHAAAYTRRVARPDLLLLGALMHDIGKGWPGDHTENGIRVVSELAPRLGIPADDVDVIVSLVRHHLLLPDTATRRDLDDPMTIRVVTEAVRDRETLQLLHALTEADALATGPAAWGDWKAGLVEELVRRAAAALSGAPPVEPAQLTGAQRALAAAGELAIAVESNVVTVAAPDRPGLLWRWAGVLALHRLDVLAASAYSVEVMALTVFTVAPRYGSFPDWTLVRDDIRRAYADQLPLQARLAERERAYRPRHAPIAPPAVFVFDDASETATVVEVRAHDQPGLLYRIAGVLADCRLDVRSAKVSTLGAEVVDAFYVVDGDGRKLTAEHAETVRAQLLDALG